LTLLERYGDGATGKQIQIGVHMVALQSMALLATSRGFSQAAVMSVRIGEYVMTKLPEVDLGVVRVHAPSHMSCLLLLMHMMP